MARKSNAQTALDQTLEQVASTEAHVEPIVEQTTEVVTKTEEPAAQTSDIVTAIVTDQTTNVSQKIRALSAAGLKMGPIVKALTTSGYVTKNGTPICFQHVRNVLNTQPKKAG